MNDTNEQVKVAHVSWHALANPGSRWLGNIATHELSKRIKNITHCRYQPIRTRKTNGDRIGGPTEWPIDLDAGDGMGDLKLIEQSTNADLKPYDAVLLGGDFIWSEHNPTSLFYRGDDQTKVLINCPTARQRSHWTASGLNRLQRCLEKASYIAVRDTQTADLAVELCPTRDIEIVPDSAFLLSNYVTDQDILSSKYKIDREKPIAALILMPNWSEISDFKLAVDEFVVECNIKGWNLLILPFSKLYGHLNIVHEFKSRYERYKNIFHINEYPSAMECLQIIKACDAVISHSYHGILAGYALGKPTVAIDPSFMRTKGPRTKILSLIADLDHDEAYLCPWLIKPRDLCESFEFTIERGVNVKKIKQAKEQVERHFDRMAAIISENQL